MPRSVSPEKRDQALEYYMRAAARVADRARPPVQLPELTPTDFKMMVNRLKQKYAKPSGPAQRQKEALRR